MANDPQDLQVGDVEPRGVAQVHRHEDDAASHAPVHVARRGSAWDQVARRMQRRHARLDVSRSQDRAAVLSATTLGGHGRVPDSMVAQASHSLLKARNLVAPCV
eukprot:2423330-Pyramimonas_sp.AAC.1